MQKDFLYFLKRQLEGEARGQAKAQAEADKQVSHEDLCEEPHGEVHVVVLDVEVEQVGHEGDLRDRGPEAPGEEVMRVARKLSPTFVSSSIIHCQTFQCKIL